MLAAALTAGTLACAGEAPREEPPPPGLEVTTPMEFQGSAGAGLPPGTCEPATGAIIGRAGLDGALYTIDPVRQILVLYDASGALRFYRDQVAGRAGYTIRIDMETDSAWAMDRTTRARVSGTVAEFSTRADFGPPVALADSVRRRCGVEPIRRPGG